MSRRLAVRAAGLLWMLAALCIWSPAWATPVTPFQRTVHTMVADVTAGRSDVVWSRWLSAHRRVDTSKASLTALLKQVTACLGPLQTVHMVDHVDRPLGAVMGIPGNEVVKREEATFDKAYQDTVWDLQGRDGSHTWLLLTLVNENQQPRILWMEFQGPRLRTAEYAPVEAPMRHRALAVLDKLLADHREALIDQDLSSEFRRRLPRDHIMSMLDDIRHHVGAVGGVGYYSGWVQHQPAGVTIDLRQKDTQAGTQPYDLLVRLVQEKGRWQVDALGDEWHRPKP